MRFARNNEVMVDVNLGQDKALWWAGPGNPHNFQVGKDRSYLAPQLGMIGSC